MTAFENNKDNTSIQVTFINRTDNSVIGKCDLPLDRLPDQFELATTMHLGEQDWSVEEAMPMFKTQFIKTGKLTLKMNKIETINPAELLFSLPTISSELPTLVSEEIFNDFSRTLLEDDWRQYEFLNKAAMPLIEQELTEIKRIWKECSIKSDETFTVFNQLHVRDAIDEPNLAVDFKQLKELLNATQVGSLKLNNQAGYIKQGFALQTDTAIYYGLVENNKVSLLAVYSVDDDLTELNKIVANFGLVFVDWCSCQVIGN